MVQSDTSQGIHFQSDPAFVGLVDSLLSLLTKEVEVYKELQEVIVEERSVLMKPSQERLYECNNKKETSILKAKMLEEVQSGIVKKLARLINRKDQDINLTLLASLAEGGQSASLLDQQSILDALIRSINALNENNKEMLDYSLSYVRSSMKFITTILAAGADYVYTGQLRYGAGNGRLINREG